MKDLELHYAPWRSWVLMENKKQIKKWGIQNHDPFRWLAFTAEELGELAKAIIEWNFRGGSSEAIVKEAVQVATLSLKIAEMFSELNAEPWEKP